MCNYDAGQWIPMPHLRKDQCSNSCGCATSSGALAIPGKGPGEVTRQHVAGHGLHCCGRPHHSETRLSELGMTGSGLNEKSPVVPIRSDWSLSEQGRGNTCADTTERECKGGQRIDMLSQQNVTKHLAEDPMNFNDIPVIGGHTESSSHTCGFGQFLGRVPTFPLH